MAYRTLPHKSTGFSPFCLLYGRKAHIPAKVGQYKYSNIQSYENAAKEHTALMREMFETACCHARLVADRHAACWNRSQGAPPVNHQVGNLVWLNQRRFNKHPRRGLQQWIGPLEITEITPRPNYSLRGSGRGGREAFSRIHPSMLKPFRGEVGLAFIP